ncbi:hypothetical protein Bca4012_083744 [Brassica carinata]
MACLMYVGVVLPKNVNVAVATIKKNETFSLWISALPDLSVVSISSLQMLPPMVILLKFLVTTITRSHNINS